MRVVSSQTAKSEMRRPAGQSEDVVAFDGTAGVVAENLHHVDLGMAVVDHHANGHLVQRENLRVGLFGVGRDQHARVSPQEPRSDDQE